MSFLFIALAVIAAGVAYGFFIKANSLESKVNGFKKTAEESSAQSQKAAKELEAARDELSRRRNEAGELREKLNDIRARQHKQRETDRKGKGSAESELADQLDTAQRRIEEERARLDVLSREAEGMQSELSRLREANKRLDDAFKAAQSAAAKVPAAAAAPSAEAAPRPAPAPAPVRDEELAKRVELLDRQLREARRKVGELDEEAKRARSKSSTATRMQLQTKSELELFREKLVWSEKRVVELERLLFDNKIAMPDREAAPQPKAPQLAPGILARESANTGGEGVVAEAADYVPETAAESSESTSAPETLGEVTAEAMAERAAAAPAPTPAVEGEQVPQAVPPIRRPRAAIEGRDDAAAKPD